MLEYQFFHNDDADKQCVISVMIEGDSFDNEEEDDELARTVLQGFLDKISHGVSRTSAELDFYLDEVYLVKKGRRKSRKT